MTHKICFYNRSSIHYRKNIYMLMDKELPCDFYFGDSRPGGIKPLPYDLLANYKGTFHNVNFGPFYWQKGVLKLLKSDYTDFITTGEPYCLSTWAMLFFARRYKKNIYLWTHGAYGDEKGLKKKLILKSKSMAKGVFLYGQYAKDILVNWGVPENKLHVVYNSLSYDEQLPLRESIIPSGLYQEHFGNNNSNLIFIGRLTIEKKLNQILEAVSKLKSLGHSFNVTFIGDGEERRHLEKTTEYLGLRDRVWFYGACYDEKQIADFLYNADICVSPGNVGLTAMHAMTFGCPVISHDNYPLQMPEFEAIEKGKTGDFFKEDNIDSLAETIKNWQSSCGDREDVRKACYKVIDEKYNPHVQIETLKNAIYNY